MATFLTRQADLESDEARSWTCSSCDTMTDGDGQHCRSCRFYWEDVENGLWEDPLYD